MWAVIVLDGLTFGTFSSLMHILSVFVLGTVAMFSSLVFSMISAAMILVSNLFTTLILEPATTATESVRLLWNICRIAIPRFFPQTVGSLLMEVSSFSNPLLGPLPSQPGCSDGTANGYSCTILYMSTLVRKITELHSLIPSMEGALPLAAMELFSWLSQPTDDTGRTRADSIADTCAQKCAIGRSHNTAPLIRVGHLLAACVGLYNLTVSGANSLAFIFMTFATWYLRPVFEKRTIERGGIPEPIHELVARIQTNKELCHGLLQVSSEQRGQINKLNGDLAKARGSEKSKNDTIQQLRVQKVSLGQTINELNNQQSRNANQKRQQTQAQISRLDNALREANEMTATLMSKVASLEQDLESSRQQHMEAQFNIELLKCTPTANDVLEASTISKFIVPFVLVLVDGDAYRWSASHFTKSQHTPGARAAQAIKDEVRKYIVDNKSQISIQSRIVVRVFQNISEGDAATIRGHRTTRRFTDEFSKDFTESMPLFDYIDCGTGKERADSKIQELVHLFIANLACHAIFFAAAKDNGFARMLEQYSCDEALRNKIVLVHPGYIIREIEALGFKSVHWPSVFQREYMPEASRQKAATMAAAAEKRKNETETATAKFVFGKTWNGLGKFRELSRGSSTGTFRKIEGDVSRVTVDASIASDGQLLELD